jgi:hypothetical protein
MTARSGARIGFGSAAVTSIERTLHGGVVNDSHGGRDSHDRVVIASHSDQALAMLSDADIREHTILGAIGYSPNIVYLHRDTGLMRKRALTSAALLRSFFSLPRVICKIVAAIHWEALRLWLKGARLVPRPDAAPAKPTNTILASGRRNDYTVTALSAAGREPGSRESALVR